MYFVSYVGDSAMVNKGYGLLFWARFFNIYIFLVLSVGTVRLLIDTSAGRSILGKV